MERIKLAILKAKEGVDQDRLDQSLASRGVSTPRSVASMVASSDRRTNRAGGHGEPQRRSWTWAAPLLLGLAVVFAFWAVRSAPRAASISAATQAVAAPAQPVVVVTPVQPAEPAPAETRNAIPASTAEPALVAGATESRKTPVPSNEQVVAAVEAWRQAWSKRDMVTYLDAYSRAFTPPDGMSREDWIASRYRNVGGRKSIDVQITRLLVLNREHDRARVSFLQNYTSGSHREMGQAKTLDLVRDVDDRWRIVGEWQGEPPLVAEAGKS